MKNKHGGKSGPRIIKKLSRFSSVEAMQPLETRTMMSASVLATPAPLLVTATSSASVTLAWNGNATAGIGLELLRAKGTGKFTPLSQINASATFQYTDTTVTAGTSYSYELKALTAKATSAASAKVTAVTPLTAPLALSASLSGSSIVLKWTDNAKTAGSYSVYRESNGVQFVLLKTISGANVTTFKDTSVTDGRAYSYEVQAQNSTATSLLSAAANIVVPLVAPSHLQVTVQSSTWIHLTWTDNDSSATGYAVLRSTNGAGYTSIATIAGATASSFDDKTAAPFTSNSYEVKAITATGASPASASATATTPLAVPTWNGPIVVGQNSITLSWADFDPAAKGFVILQSIGGKAYTQATAIASGATTTWVDTGFTTDAQYSFEVKAVNGAATSAASTAITVTSPLLAVTGLSAAATSGTSIKLNWTDNDPNATKYEILRSVDGSTLTPLTTVTGASVASYTDNAVSSGQAYAYDVIAMAANTQSGMSSVAAVVTPLAAPANLSAVTVTSGISLNWTDEDPAATGYIVLRSIDGVNFSKIATITGATVSSYTDSAASSAHTYFYQVMATNSIATSAASVAERIATPLLAPTGLTTSTSSASVILNWTNQDAQATGFIVLRSTDGINFTQLASLNSASVHTYTDATAAAGQKYYYQVQATATGFASAMSNTASATTTAITPSPTPPPSNTVSISLRYSDELVVTSTGTNDTIAISQSGSTISITADGQTTTDLAPAAGLFVYTRGGTDSISIASGVTAAATVETVDTGVDTIASAGSNVSVWEDSTDIFTGTGTVHKVNTFAGGVAKTTGASLANPSDAGTTMNVTGSLWGTGPVADDINQGEAGDCYFLASLAAFAGQHPALIQQSAVDMGDGTYIVQFMNGQTPTFMRVSNAVSTYGGGGYLYAHPGSDGDLWGAILEKAYADFRTGANTYASLNSGWMGSAYSLFGVNSDVIYPSQMSATQLYTELSADMAAGREVTFGTSNAPQLVSGHAYTLISVSMVNGVAQYVVRNPWGVSGDSLENSQGYATLTYGEMQANFYDGCESD